MLQLMFIFLCFLFYGKSQSYSSDIQKLFEVYVSIKLWKKDIRNCLRYSGKILVSVRHTSLENQEKIIF